MATLLFVTIFSITTNWNIAHNDNDDGDGGYFYSKENVIDADWIYNGVFVNVMNIICLTICSFYALLVGVILYFQVGNFCLNKTTSERFKKSKK